MPYLPSQVSSLSLEEKAKIAFANLDTTLSPISEIPSCYGWGSLSYLKNMDFSDKTKKDYLN